MTENLKDENYFGISCPNCGEFELSCTQFEEIILDKLSCPKCNSFLNFDNNKLVEISCPNCQEKKNCDWLEAVVTVGQTCDSCCKGTLHLFNSFYFKVEEYRCHKKILDVEKFREKKRADYWEIVTHFCGRKEFLSILKDGYIKAKPTGKFNKKAVCFTETPLVHAKRFREKFGNFGIAFFKHRVLNIGGQPAIYLTDDLIEAQKKLGFSDELKPFVNIIRRPNIAPSGKEKTRIDFSHEREWRVPANIRFDEIRPIGLVLPQGTEMDKFAGSNWFDLVEFTLEYTELNF